MSAIFLLKMLFTCGILSTTNCLQCIFQLSHPSAILSEPQAKPYEIMYILVSSLQQQIRDCIGWCIGSLVQYQQKCLDQDYKLIYKLDSVMFL